MLLTRVLAGVVATAAVGVGSVAPPAYAATSECGSSSPGDAPTANAVHTQLGIAAAARHVPAGRLSEVSVVLVEPRRTEEVAAYAAGIVSGAPAGDVPVGIAPGVRVTALRYGSDQGATSHDLAAALRTVHPGRHTVVLVQGVVPPSAELSAAIGRLRAALVVAPIGERPDSSDAPVLGDLYTDAPDAPATDAAGRVAPASSDTVLAVGVAGWSYAEGRPLVDSDVDVAAPVGGGLSYDGGHVCAVPGVLTNWAAAEVAGVAALTWATFPGLSASELRTRLERTADGGGSRSGATVGYGVVQPLAAVTLDRAALTGQGPAAPAQHRAPAPERPADVLAATRRSTLWWGLLGGGALVIALLVRPLRRRRKA